MWFDRQCGVVLSSASGSSWTRDLHSDDFLSNQHFRQAFQLHEFGNQLLFAGWNLGFSASLSETLSFHWFG
jgi:hypothetical protein